MRGKELVYGQEVAEWVWKRIGQETPDSTAIGLAGKDGIVSGVVFSRYSGASIELTIASEGKTWAVRDYFRAIFRYPFVQLDCLRCTAVVGAKNLKSRTLCERLGFVQEGYLRYGFKDDDAVIYGMYRNNCRWIQ